MCEGNNELHVEISLAAGCIRRLVVNTAIDQSSREVLRRQVEHLLKLCQILVRRCLIQEIAVADASPGAMLWGEVAQLVELPDAFRSNKIIAAIVDMGLVLRPVVGVLGRLRRQLVGMNGLGSLGLSKEGGGGNKVDHALELVRNGVLGSAELLSRAMLVPREIGIKQLVCSANIGGEMDQTPLALDMLDSMAAEPIVNPRMIGRWEHGIDVVDIHPLAIFAMSGCGQRHQFGLEIVHVLPREGNGQGNLCISSGILDLSPSQGSSCQLLMDGT